MVLDIKKYFVKMCNTFLLLNCVRFYLLQITILQYYDITILMKKNYGFSSTLYLC